MTRKVFIHRRMCRHCWTIGAAWKISFTPGATPRDVLRESYSSAMSCLRYLREKDEAS